MDKTITRNNHRNANGVKSSCDLYRTINGAHYIAWVICPSDNLIKTYRENGIRCRRLKDELFIHHMDEDEAKTFDQKMRQTNPNWN